MGLNFEEGRMSAAEAAKRDNKQSSNEGRSNGDENEEEVIIPPKQGDGEGNNICLGMD
ncbi:hypothetical protein CCACVL1_17597 [Corchorus capsularis]|uniref:Uncharacterized protein n=1 Tax=Corchorus capsularis TaxID=210143 RepID=A0A1R3HR64_COCAP|nr:hypothetical protein CCACVL1_17597 [Corchorus capsularis]